MGTQCIFFFIRLVVQVQAFRGASLASQEECRVVESAMTDGSGGTKYDLINMNKSRASRPSATPMPLDQSFIIHSCAGPWRLGATLQPPVSPCQPLSAPCQPPFSST